MNASPCIHLPGLKSYVVKKILLKLSTVSLEAYDALQAASWQPTHVKKTEGGQQEVLSLLPVDLL